MALGRARTGVCSRQAAWQVGVAGAGGGGLQEEPTAEGGARERGVRWGLCVLRGVVKTVTPPARPRVEPHRRRAGFAACRF